MGDLVHFGCWNNISPKACFQETFGLLNRYLDDHTVDLLSVSGDNFYPAKIKNTKFKDGKLEEKKDSKVALIHESPLAQGFRRLNELSPKISKGIKMILGNHDLQTGKKLIVSKHYPYDMSSTDFEKDVQCNIIQWELNHQGNVDLDINHVITYSSPGFVKKSATHVETLILMIDTSMYSPLQEIGENGYIECYNRFLKQKHPMSPEYTIDSLREKQFDEIMVQLRHYQYERLILIGHHPIITIKSKHVEVIKDGEPVKVNGKTKKVWEIQQSEDMPFFKELLKHISSHITTSTIYYLCADLHLFQYGIANIHVAGRDFTIHQYVVGTGGTELDDEYKHPNDTLYSIDELQGQIYRSDDHEGYHIEYQIIDYKKQCGFLVCHLKNGIKFEFHGVKSKGGTRKKMRKNRNSVKYYK